MLNLNNSILQYCIKMTIITQTKSIPYMVDALRHLMHFYLNLRLRKFNCEGIYVHYAFFISFLFECCIAIRKSCTPYLSSFLLFVHREDLCPSFSECRHDSSSFAVSITLL